RKSTGTYANSWELGMRGLTDENSRKFESQCGMSGEADPAARRHRPPVSSGATGTVVASIVPSTLQGCGLRFSTEQHVVIYFARLNDHFHANGQSSEVPV